MNTSLQERIEQLKMKNATENKHIITSIATANSDQNRKVAGRKKNRLEIQCLVTKRTQKGISVSC